ncbi:MAG: hypothetical protein JWO05_492 [Gemmatimonadetes bacterium]|nr:hypothetical protein [Gemmatimonadota bacterium]
MRIRLLAAAALTIASAACSKAARTPVARGTMADSAEQVLLGVKTVITDRGLKRGDMTADTAFVFEDQTRYVFRVIKVIFNDATGAPNGTMEAKRGLYSLRTQVLEGFGDVVVTTTDGRRLTSNHLRYNQAANEISSDSAFTLVAGDRIQKGVGFRSDPNLNRFQILKGSSGSTPIEGIAMPNR